MCVQLPSALIVILEADTRGKIPSRPHHPRYRRDRAFVVMRYAALGTSGYFATTPVRSLMKKSYIESPVRVVYHTGVLVTAFEDAEGQRIVVLAKRLGIANSKGSCLKVFTKKAMVAKGLRLAKSSRVAVIMSSAV